MPDKLFQPSKFNRSRRHRDNRIRRFLALMLLVVVYVLITWSLDRLDDTPRWARVWFPPFAVQGGSYEVDVRYYDLPQHSHIKAEMAIMRHNFQSLRGLKAGQDVSVIDKSGSTVFIFPMPNDSNASYTEFTISCDDASKTQNTVPKSVIRSGRIPILPVEHELVVRADDRPEWENVLTDAFKRGYWTANRGDPTVIGWAITMSYAFAALACLSCTGFLDFGRSLRISVIYAWFWWMMLGFMVCMGINKQLDVQMLLADICRAFAKHQGWYGQRKPVQIRVLALGACVCLACLQEVGHRLGRAPKSTWMALSGIILLGLNVLIHLVSLHLIEGVLSYTWAGLSMGDGLEIVSILWILSAALIYNFTQRDKICYILQ